MKKYLYLLMLLVLGTQIINCGGGEDTAEDTGNVADDNADDNTDDNTDDVTDDSTDDSDNEADDPLGDYVYTPPSPEAFPTYTNRALNDEIIYMLMTDRFNNGDPNNDQGEAPESFDPTAPRSFHGGDIKGITDKLQYIKDLGATAIWLTPVNDGQNFNPVSDATNYHGYWPMRFKDIEPQLGTEAEFKALVDKAHELDMKVILDVVINHTGDINQYAEGTGLNYRSIDKEPYTIIIPEGMGGQKDPEWLNDINNYNGRGDSTFVGESAIFGDVFGLDDLKTTEPVVVEGMIDIYKYWIETFKIDGFRIDTYKHIDTDFWNEFLPAITEFAKENGVPHFTVFGEAAEDPVEENSRMMKETPVQSMLDFPLYQMAAEVFAGKSATEGLKYLHYKDDYYGHGEKGAETLVTFMGNHDFGRIVSKMWKAVPSIKEDEMLERTKLAHSYLLFTRGAPVIYYGDEQGFSGTGEDGDADWREDMFPSTVDRYSTFDLVGTEKTVADDNFDNTHPLYTYIRTLTDIYKAHQTLRTGVIHERADSEGPGIYAFSKIPKQYAGEKEYVIALNTGKSVRTSELVTVTPDSYFDPIFPADAPPLASDSDGKVKLSLSGLDFVIYRAQQPMKQPESIKTLTVSAKVQSGDVIADLVRLAGTTISKHPLKVVFEMQVEDGDFTVIGEDHNLPYTMYWDSTNTPDGSRVSFRGRMVDVDGTETVSTARSYQVVNAELEQLTVRYQNGNARQNLLVLDDTVSVVGTVALDENNTGTVDLHTDAKELVLMYYTESETGFEFDAPIHLYVVNLGKYSADGSTASFYVNNSGAVSGTASESGMAPKTLKFNGSTTPVYSHPIYMRGSFSARPWEADAALVFQGNYTYYLLQHLPEGGVSFKVADSTWKGDTNFGGPLIELGLNAAGSSKNLALNVESAGFFELFHFNVPKGDGENYRFNLQRAVTAKDNIESVDNWARYTGDYSAGGVTYTVTIDTDGDGTDILFLTRDSDDWHLRLYPYAKDRFAGTDGYFDWEIVENVATKLIIPNQSVTEYLKVE